MGASDYKVYVHTFPNGKKYVGLTMQEPRKRWENGRGYKKCPKVWSAIQKYGWSSVKSEVVANGLTKEEAEAMEIELTYLRQEVNFLKKLYSLIPQQVQEEE